MIQVNSLNQTGSFFCKKVMENPSILVEKIVCITTSFFAAASLGAMTALFFTLSGSSSFILLFALSQFSLLNSALFVYSVRKIYVAQSNYFFAEIKIPQEKNVSSDANKDQALMVSEKYDLFEDVSNHNDVQNEPEDFSILETAKPQEVNENNLIDSSALTVEEIETYANDDQIEVETEIEKEENLSKNPDKDFLFFLDELKNNKEILMEVLSEELSSRGTEIPTEIQSLFIDAAIKLLFCFKTVFQDGLKGKSFLIFKVNHIISNASRVIFSKQFNQKEIKKGFDKEFRIIIKNQAKKTFEKNYTDDDLAQLASQIDTIASVISKWFLELNSLEIPRFLQRGNEKKNLEFHNDLLKILDVSSAYIKECTGGISIGKFIIKSHLITEKFSKNPPIEEFKKFLQDSLKDIKNAELDIGNINQLIGLLSTDTLVEDRQFITSLFELHIQDIILVVLIVFFAAEHFHEIRPWLKKHADTMINLLIDFMPEIKKYESVIKNGFKITLSFLKPINGLVNGNIPFKSTLIKKTISASINLLKEQINKSKSEDSSRNELEILMMDISKTIMTFFILGIFGSTSERKAYQNFKTRFISFYKIIYSKSS